MTVDALIEAVAGLPPPWRGHFHAGLASTQDEARRLADAGAPSGTIVVTDVQHGGRGRRGRTWLAPPGSALLLSAVFREQTPQPLPWRWTCLASLALVEACVTLLPDVEPTIKWPNDVLVDGRKVAGILAESSWNGDQLVVVVGIGVNVNATPVDLAPLDGRAVSLAMAAGRAVDRGALLRTLVDRMSYWWPRPWSALQAAWAQRLWGRGQRVRLVDLDRDEEVVVVGVGSDGSLRVRLADGAERLTSTGELIV